MIKKISMLFKVEKSYFNSQKLLIGLLVIYFMLTFIGASLSSFYNSEVTFEVFIYGIINSFIQFSHFGFAFILLNAFSREHSNKSFFWLKKHLFEEKDLIVSKCLFYISVILSSVLIYLSSIIFIAKVFIFKNATMTTNELFMIICIVMSSLLYTIMLQLFFGYFTKSFFKNTSLWIIFWFIISIVNGVLPILGGYLSTLDATSLQSGMLSYLVFGTTGLFGKNHNLITMDNYFTAATILPIAYSLIIFGILYFVGKRRQ